MQPHAQFIGLEFTTHTLLPHVTYGRRNGMLCRIVAIDADPDRGKTYWEIPDLPSSPRWQNGTSIYYDDCIESRAFHKWFVNVRAVQLHTNPNWEV